MNPLPPDLDARLEQMQWRADPLADDTIARIVGDWSAAPPPEAGAPQGDALASRLAAPVARLRLVSRLMSEWQTNADLVDWTPQRTEAPPEVVEALRDYLRQARELPAWADVRRIEQAERLFFEFGPLSCALLFCASLPQCYVVPDLAEVLHVTGQLEAHTDHRIRATGAMIFPVMMPGGLTRPDGAGVAQVLKVRLIHATVRHLILRGAPQRVLATLGDGMRCAAGAAIEPMALAERAADMHRALLGHGWQLGRDGLPCNQEDQAYTLLTFGFVILRGLRDLAQPLTRADEEASLHAWNVMGHFVGIEPELMAHDMDTAAALFDAMQARGRRQSLQPDPRPALGRALVDNLARAIPVEWLKPFPLLLTRRLCGARVSAEIGLRDLPVPWMSRLVFEVVLRVAHAIDLLVRRIAPRLGLVRLLMRHLGLRAVARLLMDETRPLALPEPLRQRMRQQLSAW